VDRRVKFAFVSVVTAVCLSGLLLGITTVLARPPEPASGRAAAPPQALWPGASVAADVQQRQAQAALPAESQATLAGAAYGGEFRYPTVEPATLDPIVPTAGAPPIQGQVFEGLLKWDQDLLPVPAIAESWDVTDAQTWTFHLRDDVYFHNGRKVTAYDFAYSWDRAVGSDWWNLVMASIVDHYHAPDSDTFEVVLSQAFSPLPTILPMPFLSAVPSETVGTIDTSPVGAGPFEFSHWTAGDEIVITAHDDYYDRRPYLDSVRFEFYASTDDMYGAFQAGNLDVSPVPSDQVGDVANDPNAVLDCSMCLYYYGMKVDWAPFDDVRVRQGLNYAVDRQDLVQNVLGGFPLVPDGPVPPGMQAYNPPLDAYYYDPVGALNLLAQAGWWDSNDDGILDDGAGTDLTIELWHNTSAGHAAIANAVADDFRDIGGMGVGATVVISHTDWSTYSSSLHQYPMYRQGWCADYPDPLSFLWWLFRSDQTGGRSNYSNAQVDAWLDEALHTTELSPRHALYASVEQQALDDAPLINLYYYGSPHIIRRCVHGLTGLHLPESVAMENVSIGEWLPTGGPGIEGGAVEALALHPDISGTLYAAVHSPGAGWDMDSTIYKSTDGGQSWAGVYTSSNRVVSLAAADGRVYAGALSRHGAEAQPILYRSGDSGSSWTVPLSALDGVVWDLDVHPTDADIAIAGGGVYPDNAHLWETSDGGVTWTAAFTYTMPDWWPTVNAALIHPTTPLTRLLSNDGQVDSGAGSYIHRSTDGGATWSQAYALLDDVFTDFETEPLTPTIIYAATWNNNFYRSEDGGATWAAVVTDGSAGSELVLDPSNTLYASRFDELRKSTDGGDSWTTVGSVPGDIQALAIDLGPSPGALYAGLSEWGVHKSTNGGADWASQSSDIETLVLPQDIEVDPQDLDKLFVATLGTGGWLSADGGDSWQMLPLAGHVGGFAINPQDTSIVYAVEHNCGQGAIKRSEDGGLTYQTVYTASFITSDCNGGSENLDAVAVFPETGQRVYAVGSDQQDWEASWGVILSSADGGDTWTKGYFGYGWPSSYYAVAVDPTNSLRAYAGGQDCTGESCQGFVMRTQDGGAGWVGVLTTPNAVRTIVVDHESSQRVYVSTDGYDIYRSLDWGTTWEQIRTCCPSGSQLAIDPNVPSHVYLGGWGYIAETADGGATWSQWGAPINRGAPPVEPNALAVDSGTEVQTLYAGFEGVWKYRRAAPPPTPGDPSPMNQSTDVTLNTDLDWSELHQCWTWINEDARYWSLSDRPGYLRIMAHPGWVGQENLLAQDAPPGDYAVTTRVLFEPFSNYQGAGMAVFCDSQNYLMLGRAYCDTPPPDCRGNAIYFDRVEGGAFLGLNYAMETTLNDEAYLRIVNESGTYSGYYSEDGKTWTLVGSHTPGVGMALDQVGLQASADLAQTRIAADFDFFTLDYGLGHTDDFVTASVWDVYFGTSTTPPYLESVRDSSYQLPRLGESTVYWWKVVARGECAETDAQIWQYPWKFTTGLNRKPQLGTVNPSSGSSATGEVALLTASWSDPDGWEDLKQCWLHIGADPNIVGNVTLLYNAVKNKLWLLDDSGTTWTGGHAPGSPEVMENSQAVVHCFATSLQMDDNSLSVTWAIEFKPGYEGAKKTGLKCKDRSKARAKASWKGTWEVTAGE
jgi:oligopeptide transport system substrate-binding protein